MEESGLAVAVGGLVEVHEVHVDGLPREIAVELGVEMEERFFKRGEPAYPHFGWGERVHPQDEAGAGGIGVGGDAEVGDFFGRGEEGFEFEGEREALGFDETVDDGLGVGGDLFERAGAVEMLRTANEPDFGGGEIDEGHGERGIRGRSFLPQRTQSSDTEGTEFGIGSSEDWLRELCVWALCSL